MWNFLYGFLFARATGISRFVRLALLLTLVVLLVGAIVYAATFFNAALEKDNTHHVQPHSSH
jgi:hypothetical protein